MYSTDIVGKNPEVCSREQRSRPDRQILTFGGLRKKEEKRRKKRKKKKEKRRFSH
jgi:hypothetical protein